MKIAILQTDIVWADVQSNLQRADALIDSRVEPDADILVLPEMFSTGFATQPEGIAEEEGGETLRWMRRTASRRQCAVAGSVVTHSRGSFFNRFYFVEPDGSTSTYDKRHLFTFGGEDRCIKPGNKRTVVNFRGVRIMLQVCYDLRFPVFSRNCGDYDLALYVANWPEARMDVWQTLLRARAIENQCYVAGVNRVGTDDSGCYSGGSMIVDPYGRIVAQCKDREEDVATAVLRLEAMKSFRQKFPVLDDADFFKVLETRM